MSAVCSLRLYSPEDQGPPDRSYSRMTLREMFLARMRPEMSGRAAKTIAEYHTLLSDWERLTDDPPIACLSRVQLFEFREQLQQERYRGQFRSSATINKKFRTLRAMVRQCWPADSHNPGGLGACGYFLFPQELKETKKLPYIFSQEELSRLYQACNLQSWPRRHAALTWRTILVTHFCCGPRTFDLLSLTWDDIDFSYRDCGAVSFAATKTSKLQRVPLHRAARSHLQALRAVSQSQRVFPGFTATNKSTIRRHWRKLKEAAGISATAVMEDMRKTCNTAYTDRWPGVGAWILGHRLGGVNAQNYYNPTRIVLEAVENLPVPDCFHETG